MSVVSLDAIWRSRHAALELLFPSGLKLESNDMGGRYHQKLTKLQLPHASARVYLRTERERLSWMEAAEFLADVYLDIYSSAPGWRDRTHTQTEFIRAQDSLTDRAQWMFSSFISSEYYKDFSTVTCV